MGSLVDVWHSRDAEPLARLGDPGRWPAVLAGGDPGQRDQLSPAEGRPRRGELLGDRAIVLLGVQGAVLADGDSPGAGRRRRAAGWSSSPSRCADGAGAAPGRWRGSPRRARAAGRPARLSRIGSRIARPGAGPPVQEVAAAVDPVVGDLVGARGSGRPRCSADC